MNDNRDAGDGMKRVLIFIVLLTLCALSSISAQYSDSYDAAKLYRDESTRLLRHFNSSKLLSPGQEGFDVVYYKLDLKVTTSPHPNSLRGVVTMTARSVVDGLQSVTLDLMNALTVSSVRVGGVSVQFQQSPTLLSFPLNRSYLRGEIITVSVEYQGVPGTSGFGSFRFWTTSDGKPWVWTLSEPYGAKDWWPCKDHPTDKADSVDVWITCDSGLKAASQGTLVGIINNNDGTTTYRWQHRYPISTYLVSLAIAPYTELVDWWRYALLDSMLLVNYALPAQVSSARSSVSYTRSMLEIFSNLFGLYPFVREKYGHAQFGWSGGMEHQTLTSLGAFSENLIAHELAHQWFGDMITMRSWSDIWLNEGFATYSVALYREKAYGTPAYWEVMNREMENAKSAVGTLYVRDTSFVSSLFDPRLVYSKGATVLHMLRRVLGDSVFFVSLRRYASDPALRYGVASTADFQRVCEEASHRSLSYFFEQWVYGEGYPRYRFDWGSSAEGIGFRVELRIRQVVRSSSPVYFTMPIDFRISRMDRDTVVTFLNDQPQQVFTLVIPFVPLDIELDPFGWILKEVERTEVSVDEGQGDQISFALGQNYPNPFNGVTVIPLSLAERGRVRLEVFNLLGERIASIVPDHVFGPGTHLLQFSPDAETGRVIGSGVLFYRLSVNGRASDVRKMVYVR